MLRAALAVLLVAAATPAAAHPAPFSYLDLRLDEAGLHGTIVVHDYDVAHDLDLPSPEVLLSPAVATAHRGRLEALLTARLRLMADGQAVPLNWGVLDVLVERQSLRLAFTATPERPGHVEVQTALFPYDPVHQTFVNVYEDGALRHQAILDVDRLRMEYYSGTTQGTLAVVGTFLPSGVEHILIGPDHLLFLVGLLLPGGTFWRLAVIVTAFTLGHSVTLSLAALDLVDLPARVVEPTIALSIVFVGVDNLLTARPRLAAERAGSAPPRDIRPWVAAVFGLVHGFGFASVLREIGLPASSLGWSLFSFNAGVELGQLGIVFVAAATLAGVQRWNPTAAARVAVAGSIGVILAGGWWFVERVFLTGGAS